MKTPSPKFSVGFVASLVLLLFSPPRPALAADLVVEDWSAYTVGNPPAAPWVTSVSGGTVSVQSAGGSNQLYINDPTSAATEVFQRVFAPTTANLEVSFKFQFPTTLGAATGYKFKLNSSASPSNDLASAVQFSLNSMQYRSAAGTWVYLPGFSSSARPVVGVTYTVTFGPVSRLNNTYDISWSGSNGTSGSVTGLGFANGNDPVNISSIYFGPGSGAVGSYYLDDVVVRTLPTPALSVDFPDSPKFPVFNAGSPVNLVFSATRTSGADDAIDWGVYDYAGALVRSGQIAVQGAGLNTTHAVTLTGLKSGYMEVRASLVSAGAALPAAGSRPAGLATFGVLPALAPPTLAYPSDSRFGLQGTNFIKPAAPKDWFDPVYTTLGARWAYNSFFNWAYVEPDSPGQAYARLVANRTSPNEFIVPNNGYPLVVLHKQPSWAYDIPAGANTAAGFLDQAFPPRDPTQYKDYAGVLSAEMAWRQNNRFGTDRPVYYQLDWEPDWHWQGTLQEAALMYGNVAKGIHQADPNAIVLMPTYALPSVAALELADLLPALQATGLGAGSMPDGISIHGYYGSDGDPANPPPPGAQLPPEYGGLEDSLAEIRSLMNTYLPPGAELHQTEWGVSYQAAYPAMTYDQLLKQAAYVIRGHLLFLGEGCRSTWFFYSADAGDPANPSASGGSYGLLFNLTMPNPSYGAHTVSPKPVYMAGCALTRIIDGTTTTGRLDFPASDAVYGYAFKRGTANIVAVWCKDNVDRTLTIPVGAASVTVLDFMGNPQTRPTPAGTLEITAGRYPCYIEGMTDAAIGGLLR